MSGNTDVMDNYTFPGGGLLKRTTPLTDEERQQYVDYFSSVSLQVMPAHFKKR